MAEPNAALTRKGGVSPLPLHPQHSLLAHHVTHWQSRKPGQTLQTAEARARCFDGLLRVVAREGPGVDDYCEIGRNWRTVANVRRQRGLDALAALELFRPEGSLLRGARTAARSFELPRLLRVANED